MEEGLWFDCERAERVLVAIRAKAVTETHASALAEINFDWLPDILGVPDFFAMSADGDEAGEFLDD